MSHGVHEWSGAEFVGVLIVKENLEDEQSAEFFDGLRRGNFEYDRCVGCDGSFLHGG